MSPNEKPIPAGVLFHLGRENAKRFFGLRDDEALTAFVEEIIPALAAEDVVHLGHAWELLRRCLSESSADASNAKTPLNQMIAGGRPMGQGESIMVYMVRPDIVPIIAAEAEALSESWLLEQMARLAADEMADPAAAFALLTQAGKLYRRASAARGAVVFAAHK